MMRAQPRYPLLDEVALTASAVVANCAMNRERQLVGVNSYTRVLGFNPVEALVTRLATVGRSGVVWQTTRSICRTSDRCNCWVLGDP